MNWFRRSSVGVGVPPQQEAAPTSAPAPSPSPSLTKEADICDPPQSPLTSSGPQESKDTSPSSHCDSHEATLSDAPARAVKRPANDDQMDIDEGELDFEYNSSGVCPKDGARHNQRVTKRPPTEHLLHLPESIQQLIYSFVLLSDTPYQVSRTGKMIPKPAVYWKIRDDHSLTKKELKKHNGTAVCKPPGLLTACKQIRKLSLDVFYVGNDFDVQISKFWGEGIMKWWKRVRAVRIKHSESPTLKPGLCGATPSERLGIVPHNELRKSLRFAEDRGKTDTWDWHLRYYNATYFNTSFPRFSEGKIELKVTYEPDWNNLVTWLNLCIMGCLPAYAPTNLDREPFGHRLQTVAWLFAIVDQYSREDWLAFDKTIDTHREHLIRDDPRWADEDHPCYLRAGWAHGPDMEEAQRRASIGFISTNNSSDDHGPSSSDHAMSPKTPDYGTFAPSASVWPAQTADTVPDHHDELYDSEAQEELYDSLEEEDLYEDSSTQHEAETANVPDSAADEMEVEDGHRHKRRKFLTAVEHSGDESDIE